MKFLKFLGIQPKYYGSLWTKRTDKLKVSPDVWSRIKKFILWWIRIFPLETKFSFSPIGQFSFWILVLSLTLTSDINLLIEIIIKIHFSQNRFFFQNRNLSVSGKLKWRITKMFLNFHKGGDHFWRIYTHIEYIRQKNTLGPTIHSTPVNHRIHSPGSQSPS